MAQDGYRGATEPPPPFYNHPDSRSQNSHPYYPTDPYRSRSRHSSRDRAEPRAAPEPLRFSQSQRPIDEAVSTAFNQTDMSGINPDLVAQITQNVIHQLRTSIDSGTPVTATQNHYPSVPLQQPVPLSPSTQSNTSPPIPSRNVYTPPSPQKHTDLPSHNSPESRPPMPQDSPPSPKDQREYDQRSHSRASIGSDANVTRPKGPDRLSTALEETPLEKIWGQLFDEHGKPTARLSQFLRGLAVHLIEDYEPKCSLVVTPAKMAKFYEDVRLPKEAYPWSVVFDDTQASISRMYRALEIQHHLVQEPEHLNERPDIPGLTPIGFERWQTLMIQAHPEEEFERLKKAMLEMPINNPDDKKERFPKDISRRLFPTTEDLPTRERLIRAMEEHARVTISRVPTHDTSRRSTQYNVVPPHRKPSDSSLNSDRPFGNSIERERQPYSNPADYESPIEDESNLPTPQPIERERQPYRATPGGGRVYEDTDGRNTGPSVPPPPPPPQSAPLHRANSTSTRPLNIPPPPATRPPEINQHHHHASISGRRRNHSPAPVNDFRRSDSDIRTFQPGSYGSSTIDDYEIDPRRYPRDTELRRGEYGRGPSPSRRYESERRATGHEEDYYRNAPRRDPNGRPGYNATR